MGNKTGISWTDATWNIARGCSKKNEDCLYCYMMRDGERFKYDGKKVVKTKTVFNLPDRIESGKKVMVSSLTDIFHEDCDSFREEMYDVMRRNKDKIYQFITKRWERMDSQFPNDWGDGWDNVWLGCSAGSQDRYDEMMPHLKDARAKLKWVSLEPLHKPITNMRLLTDYKDVLSFVVVGGESGNETGKYRYRECKIEWIESIVNQCIEANVPVFVKQLGTHLSKSLNLKDRHGADIDEFPEQIKFQEFPK